MKVIIKNGLPKLLGACALVYLVAMPPFAISIGWSACMELFIANTAGLLSGYMLWAGIKYDGLLVRVSRMSIILSVLFGMISLFTYQNGFGCFFIPFLIELIASKKIRRSTYIGIGVSMMIFIAYFLLFKYSLSVSHLALSGRGSLAVNPLNKLLFFLTRPLVAAFHFTWLVNEQSVAGLIGAAIIAIGWMVAMLIKQGKRPLKETSSYLLALLVLLMLIYLPSLIVKENFASNRTLLALDLAVFILVMQTFLSWIPKDRTRRILAGGLCVLLFINGWYNFNKQFADPLQKEYSGIKAILADRYGAGIRTVHIIRPREDAFTLAYATVSSWDEFGVPSTFTGWTPEPLVRQLIFEKTGNRAIAEKVDIQSWPDRESFFKSERPALGSAKGPASGSARGPATGSARGSGSDSVLLLDVEKEVIIP